VKIEIGLPKETNEMSERRTIIAILGPLETSRYKTRHRHICNCIVNIYSWRRIRILTMNPSAPHMGMVIGNPNKRYKKILTCVSEVRESIRKQIDPISHQVLLRSMTIGEEFACDWNRWPIFSGVDESNFQREQPQFRMQSLRRYPTRSWF
jgi:hypothetical protein